MYNINRTIKCLKRLQKRSIDDNLRQLVLIRQDSVLVNLEFFFFTFPKKWVGPAMGNEEFYGDGLIRATAAVACDHTLSVYPCSRAKEA